MFEKYATFNLFKKIKNMSSSTDEILKATTRIHKITQAKKCGYKGKIESTKRSGGNSDIPEKVERTRRADANERPPKLALVYQPVGERNTGRRWLSSGL
jgi:hypothetical protein